MGKARSKKGSRWDSIKIVLKQITYDVYWKGSDWGSSSGILLPLRFVTPSNLFRVLLY
jgi:hypothetical protein